MPKEGEMATLCAGNWINSKVGGANDGTIEVKDGVGGVITGRHANSKKGIFGSCVEGDTPHITFFRRDGNCVFVYDGDVELVRRPAPHLEIRNGTVTKICVPRNKDKVLAAPDDWTAEKPT
jgi:hypothetical protein